VTDSTSEKLYDHSVQKTLIPNLSLEFCNEGLKYNLPVRSGGENQLFRQGVIA